MAMFEIDICGLKPFRAPSPLRHYREEHATDTGYFFEKAADGVTNLESLTRSVLMKLYTIVLLSLGFAFPNLSNAMEIEVRQGLLSELQNLEFVYPPPLLPITMASLDHLFQWMETLTKIDQTQFFYPDKSLRATLKNS